MRLQYETDIPDDDWVVEWNDGRLAANIDLDHGDGSPSERGMWVRLQSTDNAAEHSTLLALVGHRVRVTIETID